MTNRFQHLAPAHVQALIAYDPGYEPSELQRQLGLTQMIELGSNESSLGAAPAVREFLSNPKLLEYRYPDAGGQQLKQALSARYGLDKSWFTLGNGTHELLTLIAETFCNPGDEVLHAQYGFAVYRLAALGAGATPVAAPADANLHVSPDAMLGAITARTKLVYLANPNNPTGAIWSRDQLRYFLQRLPAHVIFVLDEAYIEFVTTEALDSGLVANGLSELAQYPNLVIARTFSKAYGLASLRVGYTIADPDFAQMLERTRLSFNVNRIAMAAASIALTDQQHIQIVRNAISEQRQWLTEQLTQLRLAVYPSHGNFVLVNFDRDASAIEKALVNLGVIVRPVRAYQLPQHLRITVGNAAENQALVNALTMVLAQQQ
jgi:histidinol-phosphate aminotransferase